MRLLRGAFYDMRVSRWHTFWIDDRVPVWTSTTNAFTQPNGNEMSGALENLCKDGGLILRPVGHPRWARKYSRGTRA